MSTPTTILIVDDDPDFREFVHIVLESHDYRVLEADNAPAGLALMHAHLPDAVLLDAMMSYELAGIGIIRTVRSDPALAGIPLILISAVLAQDEDRFLPADERAMVDRFLSKPVSPDELITEITTVLVARERATESLPGPLGLPANPDSQGATGAGEEMGTAGADEGFPASSTKQPRKENEQA